MAKLTGLMAVVLVVCGVGTARAQPSGAPPAGTAQHGDEKSPELAVVLSISAMLVGGMAASVYDPTSGAGSPGNVVSYAGIALAAVGPTVGHIYADDPWNAGIGIRLAGVCLIVVSASEVSHGAFGDEIDINRRGLIELAAGAALYTGGAIYEIATAPSAVRAYNRAHAARTAGWSIAPSLGNGGTGLALVGRF